MAPPADARVAAVLKQFWGYETLRPHQADAIAAGLDKRDSLVVLPTGGGKSLCYQIPPAVAQRTDLVVSPLISLMKDQVDGLRACGYAAEALYSGLTPQEVERIEREALAGKLRLLFVAPERLLTNHTLGLVRRIGVGAIAIDEAHCISHWGHDFRPEYRRLREIKQQLPGASVHAYTATATKRVRDDIISQLGFVDPTVLVGSFDRPNLTYRVIPRTNVIEQILEILTRHRDPETRRQNATIIYCISRRETEEICGELRRKAIRAAHYHAGMEAEQRHRTQEAFSEERLDVIVATVAFGMGIDRSDVRCVIHAGMPKSVEHYQQEAGRAGRDGLPAECVLLYSAADALKWEGLIGKSAMGAAAARGTSAGENSDGAAISLELLSHLRRYCSAMDCRHRMLVEYFDQPFPSADCGACDVCLGELGELEDGTIAAQKVLSCVARVGESFGVGHVVGVLLGDKSQQILARGHDRLSTFGLMTGAPRKRVTDYVYQLLDQQLVGREGTEFPVLKLNAKSWEVLRGKRTVKFRAAMSVAVRETRAEADSWDGVDRGLFESLRRLRREVAEERGVPPFVVFSDATLRDLARRRPTTARAMLAVHGVGERKLSDLGPRFLPVIREYCTTNGVAVDIGMEPGGRDVVLPENAAGKMNAAKRRAFELFEERMSVADVSELIGRAASTTNDYLAEFIEARKPRDVDAWVDVATQARIDAAAQQSEDARLKPIFDALGGDVSYDAIRIVLRHRKMSTV